MPIPPDAPPRELRFLKWLVSLLAGVMILGILVIVGLLAIRLGPFGNNLPALPERIEMPEGAAPGAITVGAGWFAVVTEAGDEILIFDSVNGSLRQRVQVDLAP